MAEIESEREFTYNPEATAESGEESGTEANTAKGYYEKNEPPLPQAPEDNQPLGGWNPNAVEESREADEAWGKIMEEARREEEEKEKRGKNDTT